MTLVVAIVNDQTAFMLSDILLTSKPNSPGEQDQPHPTQSRISVPQAQASVISGLCQKVVELKPGLFLGWSGDWSIAQKLVDFLRYAVRPENATRAEVKLAQEQFFALHREDVADLSTIIMSISGDDAGLILYNGAMHAGNMGASIDGLGDVVAIGSGAAAFFNYISTSSLRHLQDVSQQLPQSLRQTSFVLEYILRTMGDQHLTGNGLDQGWGGAFELILSREATKFEKFGSTIMASCYWDLEGDVIKTMSFGKRYLQFYDAEDLVVICQDRKSEVERYRITPPDKIDTARSESFPAAPRSIQMLCLLTINRSTQKHRVQTSYNQFGHWGCGFKPEAGMDYAIRINTELLTDLIRESCLSDAT